MFHREFWESGSVVEGVLLGMRLVIQSRYAARRVGIGTMDSEHRLMI